MQPSETAFSGVRSSWEIVARNSSRVRLAASASRRAASASVAARSATRRARRSSATSAVRSRPSTTNSARCVCTATLDPMRTPLAASAAPRTVTASALSVPANHAAPSTVVLMSRNRPPSSMTAGVVRDAR